MESSNFTPGERIDKALVKLFPQYSRSQLQKRIVEGDVLVNGKNVTKHYALEEGDVISLNEETLPEQEIFVLEPNSSIAIDVEAETDQYIVVRKQAGVVMHPGEAYKHNDTLVNGLLAMLPQIAEVGQTDMRPGIVHRLDKDVSGLVVVAKTQEMYKHLQEQFANRTVKKIYMALVHGVLSQETGVINFGIKRSTRDFTKMAAVPSGEGKRAVTRYDVEQQFQHYALLRLQIETGRTHQIRTHCNAIGHPIVGDPTYKPKKFTSRMDNAGRLFLHATTLAFTDLEGNMQEYTMPMPEEMQSVIDALY